MTEQTSTTPKVIVELSNTELQFLATVIHVILEKKPGAVTPTELLNSLVIQTDLVFKDSTHHGVGCKPASKAILPNELYDIGFWSDPALYYYYG